MRELFGIACSDDEDPAEERTFPRFLKYGINCSKLLRGNDSNFFKMQYVNSFNETFFQQIFFQFVCFFVRYYGY